MPDLATSKQEYHALLPFTTMYSGGATQEASQKPKPLIYAKKDTPHMGIAEPQNAFTDINSSFCRNVMRHNPVGMAITPKKVALPCGF